MERSATGGRGAMRPLPLVEPATDWQGDASLSTGKRDVPRLAPRKAGPCASPRAFLI